MIDRFEQRRRIDDALRRSRAVLLVGARQVGKTTLARSFLDPSHPNYFDLENPVDLARLEEPMLALSPLSGLVVIDEVQLRPDLFAVLRVLIDRTGSPARFLVLGSASPDALRQAAESLTGRLEVVELDGLTVEEIGADAAELLWLRGGFPGSFLADTEDDSTRWRLQYVRNLAMRDLPAFGAGLPAATIERYLGLVAHYDGQLWNAAVPARALGISQTASRRYLDLLQDALLARVLLPWKANTAKRLVRTPKVYWRDSGLAHALLGIRDSAELLRHPLHGSTWEGFAIGEVLAAIDEPVTPYFWRTSNGAEIDLILNLRSGLLGVEFKRADAPKLTASMRAALDDLGLRRLLVMYPGTVAYDLADRVSVHPLTDVRAVVRG